MFAHQFLVRSTGPSVPLIETEFGYGEHDLPAPGREEGSSDGAESLGEVTKCPGVSPFWFDKFHGSNQSCSKL